MNIDSEDGARRLHEEGVKVYEYLGYNNFSPTVFAVPPDGDEMSIVIIPEMRVGEAYVRVQRIIMALPFVPQAVAITTDSFCYSLGKLSEEESRRYLNSNRRPLAELFNEGDPHVSEMLQTMVLSSKGQWMIGQRYKWTVYDGFEWEEPITAEEGSWDYDRLINGKPKLNHNGHPICPLCDHLVPNDEKPGEYPGAISRRDNRTEICSDCGVVEAMEDFAKFIESERDR
jgi:hypothetical protein